ncbi:hypothetical protein SteCoe_5561 [Stentor coeruleus]|uniref:Uncharacterized protein n=1 Tax=Stentor coeruleus TaxID=5963 RepID=A0A1R2CRZ7_9CILI|nr:hypothetical protein SteCoe_5561 [Stentor coeruleus]
MRPLQALVIVYTGEIPHSESLNNVISNGICGRLVLKGQKTLTETISSLRKAKFFSDYPGQDLEHTQNPIEYIQSQNFNLIYGFFNVWDHVEKVIQFAEDQNFFISFIWNQEMPVEYERHPITPLQSYQFDNCEMINEELNRSVFFVDYEKNYTRKDWIRGYEDIELIGASRFVLCEKHHEEVLARLGVNPKYGS